MIVSFRDQTTEDFYHNRKTRRAMSIPPGIRKTAWRKLDILNAAYRLIDLQAPPGNRLEALKGDLEGYFSIRVNDHWRIIFCWEHNDAYDVGLVDYH
ncbi:MAG: type II toxin-antitoxin system RelE/ParE family toxin [Anaerolineales bacterium]|nr:type II toxin-antitoxin system RelE/ParE family toxin [Anaerolineales bacterium]